MLAIVGLADGYDPPGFLCVKCERFWEGPLGRLAVNGGSDCKSGIGDMGATDGRTSTTFRGRASSWLWRTFHPSRVHSERDSRGLTVAIAGENTYSASVVADSSGWGNWTTPEPMAQRPIVDMLTLMGWSTTDIESAFGRADPYWRSKPEGEPSSGLQVEMVADESYMAVAEGHPYLVNWTSKEPMASGPLIRKLAEIGWHPQDISDAFSAAAPGGMGERR